MEKGSAPILTIAVPTYNGAKTIKKTLDILLPQITEEVEVIISDNCSTDNTSELIKKYVDNYPFIVYLRNNINVGADGNFLKCIRQASGEFVMLLSDDDILLKDSVARIVDFLKKHPGVQLAYLHTIGFKDEYSEENCYEFSWHSRKISCDVVTTDKKEFFSYVDRQWGFTSCFVCNTHRCMKIPNPESYFNTYWLQSYIHILCSNKKDDELGIIYGPCVAAGAYDIIGNYDTAQIECINYRKMLDYAIDKAGYDKKQLYAEWLWKVCYLAKRAVIKEKSIGKELTSCHTLFVELKKYPYAWLTLFPFLVMPRVMCKQVLFITRTVQGRKVKTYLNRPTSR